MIELREFSFDRVFYQKESDWTIITNVFDPRFLTADKNDIETESTLIT